MVQILDFQFRLFKQILNLFLAELKLPIIQLIDFWPLEF